ncbi:hypothetical protein OG205_16560 [Lentzea sp. NBC_00516]|uniref:hypothetical protein n=1 Tax=Lentzea sp. NBC_00516 TaxID=2903582 RepID=UPI002E80E36B|nr:hypothetical protein [Lentzea sp. NBC_00516]WUD28547.1 hypothetical protein OG205_16560 [Lentzea sp. NBC_00516]
MQDGIRLLGYRPHADVRRPANSRTNSLALVLPLREGVRLPMVMRFVISVVTAALKHEMDVHNEAVLSWVVDCLRAEGRRCPTTSPWSRSVRTSSASGWH